MEKDIKDALISKLKLFSETEHVDTASLASKFIIDNVKKGSYIFEEGLDIHWVYFVIEGRIKLLAHSPCGKDVILKIASSGDILTDNGVIFSKNEEYAYSAQGLVDSVVAKISVIDFKNILNNSHSISLTLIKHIDNFLKESYLVIKDMALEKVERRIAINIVKLAANAGVKTEKGIEISIKLSRQDIANLSGTTIETAIRVMSKFKKDGIITEEKGLMIISKRHQLVSIADMCGK